MNLDEARRVQAQIRGYLQAPASSLQAIPEIENDSPQDAIRKLQVQLLALTDALVASAEQAERLNRRRP